MAQTHLRDSRNEKIFHRAQELYHKQKFAAAQEQFREYALVGDNDLMVSEARFYEAMCMAELMNTEAPSTTKAFRDNHPENTRVGESHYLLGKYHFRKKNYPKALEEFIEIDPFILTPDEAKEYYFMAGYCQFHKGNIHEAKPYFKEIVNFSGDYYHLTNYFYGYITFEENEFEEALKAFQRIEDHENFKDIMPVYITEVYALMGNLDEVISYGSEAVKKESIQKKHVIHLLLAQAYFKKNDIASAKTHYDKYAQTRELTAEDAYQYGYACYITKDYKTALRQFENFVVEEDSLGQNVSYHLAGTYLETGNKTEARNAFSTAMKMGFDKKMTEDAHFNFAKLSYELKFHKIALKALGEFRTAYPKSAVLEEVQELLVRLLLQSNNYKEAFDVIETIETPSPKLNAAYQRLAFNIGTEYYEIKDFVKSRVYFNKSLKRPSSDKFVALAHYWIGESLTKEDRFKEAIKSYRNYQVSPGSKGEEHLAISHYNLGFCHFKLGSYKEALYHYEEYQKVENTIYAKQFNSDAYARVGDCYQKLRIYDKALDNYEKVVKLDYSDVDYALYQKGMIYGLREQHAEKIRTMEVLTKKHLNSGYFDDALYQMANERFLVGNKLQALREFQYLNQDFPGNLYYKVAQVKMGIIYNQLGKPRQALGLFESVLSQFPSSPESQDALGVMKSIYVEMGKADSFYIILDNLAGISYREPEKDSTLFTQAILVINKGDCSNSVVALDKYLDQFENGLFKLQALSQKAECFKKLGNLKGALATYDAIIASRPNPSLENALINATVLCFEYDSFAMAIPYLKLQEEISNGQDVLLEVYEGLARAYLETDSCNEAQNYLGKIALYENADSTILSRADYTLARCLMKNGDNKKAIGLFQKVADESDSKLGAESQYLVGYLYYLEGNYDSSKVAVINVRDKFSSYEYFVAKSFILMADNFVKMGKLSSAKSTLTNIIDYYEGEDLKELATNKLKAVEDEEKRLQAEKELIQKTQEDSIEYNDKTE